MTTALRPSAPDVISIQRVTAPCLECNQLYILDSVWKVADKKQHAAWRRHGLTRHGGGDVCSNCSKRTVALTAKVTGRCFECSGVYVLDHAWSTASDEQRDAWTEHRVARHGTNGVCDVCESAIDDDVNKVIEAYAADELAALDRRIAGERPEGRAAGLDDDWASQLSLEGFTPESAIVRVLAELAGQLDPAPGRWVSEGACREFGVDFNDSLRGVQVEAQSICRTCPMRAKCLDYALRNVDGACDGIWGGETQKSLDRIRREARNAAYDARGIPQPSFGTPNPEYSLSA